ncbi:MAG TPA: WecB/TagA/CpsF family glycosyltransferase [Actinomycetota bacterium]|nr:WecB/TagA/CpsF family glycosyltransferase [Actinomycetota bacterium]
MQKLPPIEIMGVPLARLTPAQAIETATDLFEGPDPAWIAHTNAHTLNLAYTDPAYGDTLRRADLVLNDGKGVMLAARLKRQPFPADLNGNFFSPLLLETARDRGWRVFFLGAGPGVADHAAAVMTQRLPGLQIAGTRDGYFSSDEEAIAAVKAANAELLFVGMGNPLQERWIDRCLPTTGARLAVGVGAFYDFITGTVPRAPAWMNRIGLEWLHRLALEPKRMWRRYILGNPAFLWRALRSSPGPGARGETP